MGKCRAHRRVDRLSLTNEHRQERSARLRVDLLFLGSVGGDESFAEPNYLAGVTVEHAATAELRLARLATISTLYVALPGSLMSAIALYRTWVRGGGGEGRKPVVFLDHRGAFKVVRGYAADVLSTSIKSHDRYIQFADSVEDIWNRVAWLVDQGATNAA